MIKRRGLRGPSVVAKRHEARGIEAFFSTRPFGHLVEPAGQVLAIAGERLSSSL